MVKHNDGKKIDTPCIIESDASVYNKFIRKQRRKNADRTRKFLINNNIVFRETKVKNIVEVLLFDGSVVFVSLRRREKWMIKYKYEGYNKWYTAYSSTFLTLVK